MKRFSYNSHHNYHNCREDAGPINRAKCRNTSRGTYIVITRYRVKIRARQEADKRRLLIGSIRLSHCNRDRAATRHPEKNKTTGFPGVGRFAHPSWLHR